MTQEEHVENTTITTTSISDNKFKMEALTVENADRVKRPPKQRRFDSIAWLIQGNNTCGASFFDGENLLLATNSSTESDLIKKVKHYLKLVASRSFDLKKQGENDFDEQTKKEIEREKTEIINHALKNIILFKNNNFNFIYAFLRSLNKVTESIKNSYLNPKEIDAFPAKLSDAIKEGKIEFIVEPNSITLMEQYINGFSEIYAEIIDTVIENLDRESDKQNRSLPDEKAKQEKVESPENQEKINKLIEEKKEELGQIKENVKNMLEQRRLAFIPLEKEVQLLEVLEKINDPANLEDSKELFELKKLYKEMKGLLSKKLTLFEQKSKKVEVELEKITEQLLSARRTVSSNSLINGLSAEIILSLTNLLESNATLSAQSDKLLRLLKDQLKENKELKDSFKKALNALVGFKAPQLHAELRILNHLFIKNKIVHPDQLLEDNYIGISKKCCNTCTMLFKAVNEVIQTGRKQKIELTKIPEKQISHLDSKKEDSLSFLEDIKRQFEKPCIQTHFEGDESQFLALEFGGSHEGVYGCAIPEFLLSITNLRNKFLEHCGKTSLNKAFLYTPSVRCKDQRYEDSSLPDEEDVSSPTSLYKTAEKYFKDAHICWKVAVSTGKLDIASFMENLVFYRAFLKKLRTLLNDSNNFSGNTGLLKEIIKTALKNSKEILKILITETEQTDIISIMINELEINSQKINMLCNKVLQKKTLHLSPPPEYDNNSDNQQYNLDNHRSLGSSFDDSINSPLNSSNFSDDNSFIEVYGSKDKISSTPNNLSPANVTSTLSNFFPRAPATPNSLPSLTPPPIQETVLKK